MTGEEAIAVLESDAEYMYSQDSPYCREAYQMAVEALEVVGKIKEIINISNFVIQEDVLKYKMICEVVERMDGREK